MKKLMILMAIAIAATVMTGCSNDFDQKPKEEPKENPQPDPQPQPEPKDTTGWRYSTVMDQTVDFKEPTEMVEAMNISELTRQVGNYSETKLDTATLQYKLGVDVSAPTRIVTASKDTTVYSGKGKEVRTYGEFTRQGTDSLHTVTTTVEGGFRTQYYTVSLSTSRVEGYSLHAGKWVPYLNVTETSQLTSVWHEALYEVEISDSIFNREVVHNMIKIAVKGNFTPKYIHREKVVIVDHFLKIKEKEEEDPGVTPDPEPTVKADDYLKGLSRFVSATKVYNTDKKVWGDAYLFEGSESYLIFTHWYNKEDKYQGYTSTEVDFTTCPKSNDYNGVAYIKGKLYPGMITPNGKLWAIGCYINGSREKQDYNNNSLDITGIKNFVNDNSAYPTPYIINTPSETIVNGGKVISVTGKTSVHTNTVTIADASLKK